MTHDENGRCNVALERLLARAGWTPENLGDRLNELGAALRLRAHVHRRTPRRWVYAEGTRATPRVPREPWPALVCHLLHQRLGQQVKPDTFGWASPGSLSYVPADDGFADVWNTAGAVAALAQVVDADLMERRHFLALTGLSLTAVAHQWLFDPARVAASLLGKRVDHAVVDDLEGVVAARRRMDDALGGGTLLPAVREDLRLVVSMLRNSAYHDDVGRRLYAVAAELGRLAGWLASDSKQPALAQRFFMAAVRSAHLSGDRAIGANILGFMSIEAAFSESPRDSITLAETALKAEPELTPVVAASLHARMALGAAYAGEPDIARHAQERAFERLSEAIPEHEPEWIYWFTEADAHGIAGQSLLTLDKPAEAEPHLRRTIALLDPKFTRDRAGWLCHLATARLKAGAVEQACGTASEAGTLIRRLDSPSAAGRLAEFRAAAAPYSRISNVQEFDAKFGDLIGPSRA
ncbi:hypothetical protein [Pseudonocardia acaciae]|uniref:hypothetical protein n=1 Tax=Pseudonocardia acaciae TaxID=551276 RepID=UPI0012EDD2A1|nr:hypothetical protein [Pseudonocardia acaciae]